MSKVTKFLSIGIDMMKVLPDDDPLSSRDYWKNRRCFTEGRMDKVLTAFEAWLKESGKEFKPEVKGKTGTVECHVSPKVSEVRFYPKHGDMKPGDEYVANRHIDFIRKVTGENGSLTCDIPEGDYLVKVSKGSEFSYAYTDITVKAGKTVTVSAELTHLYDIEKEGYYAGDIHHHSIYSSPVWGGTDDVIESPKEVADSMRALGLKYGALSDHHNILNHEEWKKTETEDFLPIPSKEISTSNGHVLSLGVDGFDVIYDIPLGEARTESVLRKEFIRMTDEIKEHGGLAQLNHPRDHQVSISWNKDFYDMTDIFETMEIWNGSNPMYYGTTNALAADFWRDLLEQGRFIPATSGSDTHNTRADDYHKLNGLVLWLCEEVRRFLSEDHKEFKEDRHYLEFFMDMTFRFAPLLEEWAKTSLTSGCVRTYVKLPGKPNRESVLYALRHGRSFLTNGPILELSVNGAGMGETAFLKEEGNVVKVRVRSNRPVKKVILYTSGYEARELPLGGEKKEYEAEISNIDLTSKDYIFAVAVSDVTNLAITNPVKIKHLDR
ncbi:MAG: CehA/McbA family metallohydrolase [Lachnospiraceae bacterium]|nr:CehA/McbA family metallohydrolase [Lachnospiraceae bacterium]